MGSVENQIDHPNQTAFAVVTTSGPDKPGVSAAFFRVLSSYNVELVDVEQTIFSGRISLSAYIRVDNARIEAMEKGLRNTLSIYAQSLTVELRADEVTSRPRSTHVVVVLGRQLNASHISAIAQELANFNVNIDRIRGLSTYPLNGLELYITIDGSSDPVRAVLARLATEQGVDIAIERSGLQRRSKRLICFDCDSTLITG